MTFDCSNYSDLLHKIHSGNGSDYRLELETVWNSTSGEPSQEIGGAELISTRDIFLECLKADFKYEKKFSFLRASELVSI
jgi:hypothetical protein